MYICGTDCRIAKKRPLAQSFTVACAFRPVTPSGFQVNQRGFNIDSLVNRCWTDSIYFVQSFFKVEHNPFSPKNLKAETSSINYLTIDARFLDLAPNYYSRVGSKNSSLPPKNFLHLIYFISILI